MNYRRYLIILFILSCLIILYPFIFTASAETITVNANDPDGVIFTAPVENLYRFTITGGQYNLSIIDTGTGGNITGWFYGVYIYINHNVQWNGVYPAIGESIIPDNWNSLYEHEWYSSPSAASSAGAGRYAYAWLPAGGFVNILIPDKRDSYSDNIQGVTISVTMENQSTPSPCPSPIPSPVPSPLPTSSASKPAASFTYSPAKPMAGGIICFNATKSADIVDYRWDFGDGTTSSSSSADTTHIYDSPYLFTVKLTVTDRNGNKDTAYNEVDLTLNPGDILLCRSQNSYVPGYWTHAGLYIGDGKVVEAANKDMGVIINDLSNWHYPYKTCVMVGSVDTDDATRRAAVDFALRQEGQPFDLESAILGCKQSHGPGWYCSELVWASYLYASQGRINLDPFDNEQVLAGYIYLSTVYPTDLTSCITLKASHTEVVPSTLFMNMENNIIGIARCPIDVEVTDPDGKLLSKDVNQIEGAFYQKDDVDGDGDPEILFYIPDKKVGNYTIKVIPDQNAKADSVFSLSITSKDITTKLRENAPVSGSGATIIIQSTGDDIIPLDDIVVNSNNITSTPSAVISVTPAILSPTVTPDSSNGVPCGLAMIIPIVLICITAVSKVRIKNR